MNLGRMSTTISQEFQESSVQKTHTAKKTHTCLIKNRYRLNRDGSTKETYHLELDISNLPIEYKEGSSIAIYPENPHWVVEKILDLLHLDYATPIHDKKTSALFSIKDYLLKKTNLSRLSSSLLSHFITYTKKLGLGTPLETLFDDQNASARAVFTQKHDLLSFLEEFPGYFIDAESLCSALPPLLPRFYSIASSYKKKPNEIHLLIACFKYDLNKSERVGIGSDYLCKVAKINESPIQFYLQDNIHFSLPSDPSIPIIMIGPGTGVAPFRGFIQSRMMESAPTKNWLFFGERQNDFDFYYKDELLDAVLKGHLKLETAFSRDQKEKIYVQHKLLEHQQQIWDWIQNGAIIYICGDAKKMSKDVEKTFLTIIQESTQSDLKKAQDILKSLKKAKKFLLDVY